MSLGTKRLYIWGEDKDWIWVWKHNYLESGDPHKNYDSVKQYSPLSEKAEVEVGILAHPCHSTLQETQTEAEIAARYRPA